MELFTISKVILTAVLLNACSPNTSSQTSKVEEKETSSKNPSLDLDQRIEFSLPTDLEEVSGHTFVNGDDNIVYAIQDEKGVVYAFNLTSKTIERTIEFGSKGDYEGITNDGVNFFVLKSNGDLYTFPVQSKAFVTPKVFKNLVKKGEYESLGIDTTKKQLFVLCKECKADRKARQSTGYILDYNNEGNITLSSTFSIDLNEILKLDSRFPRTFNPSAMTKKTSTNEWYIISSIDKVLLVTDHNFMPLQLIPFSRKNYEQPEGLAFDSKENLYISSEMGEEQAGMLYKIK